MNKSICKVSHNGDKYWYFNNHIHREDGPAIEYTNGDCEFWLYGLRHRLDGPAVDWADDKQWFYMDKHIECKSQEEFKRLIKLKAFW